MQLDHLRILILERLDAWCDEYGSVTWLEEGLVEDVGRASREVLDLLPEMDTLAESTSGSSYSELTAETIRQALEALAEPWAEVDDHEKAHLPTVEALEKKLLAIFELTGKEPDERDLYGFPAALATHRLNALRSAFLVELESWLATRREEGMVDDDLIDSFETAARSAFDLLSDLATSTDGQPGGKVGDLDEEEVRATFEAFAEHWDEVEWRTQTRMPDPRRLEDTLVAIHELLQRENPGESALDEFVEQLAHYLETSLYPMV